jgi:hypothetical protein
MKKTMMTALQREYLMRTGRHTAQRQWVFDFRYDFTENLKLIFYLDPDVYA